MRRKASEIYSDFEGTGLLTAWNGLDVEITDIASVETGGPGDLVVVARAEYLPAVEARRPSAVVIKRDLASRLGDVDGLAVFESPNPDLARAFLGQRYVDRDVRASEWAPRHPSAVVHETASVPESVLVGPCAVIGRDVRLGERCVVMSNAVIEHGVTIGENTVIHPGVVVAYDTVIGRNCIVLSGAVIGSEGFGFAQDEDFKSHRIPQRGRVVIGDDVVIGANDTIDRATSDETRIGSGCKLDNLVHIAHNVTVGENSLFQAQSGVAGSTRLGKRVIVGGQSGIRDHLTIADDAILMDRAGVKRNLKEGGLYVGHQAEPYDVYARNQEAYADLAGIRERVAKLERRLEELSRPMDRTKMK